MTTLQKIEDLIYRGFKETDERFEQYRRKLEKQHQQYRRKLEKQHEQHRRILEEEYEKQRLKSDERIERMHQQLTKELNGVTESLSRFSEQMVFPATKQLFRERGIRLNLFYSNMEAHDLSGGNMETDIIGLGPKCAVLIEVKLRLRLADVKEFLEEKLPRFFDFFPSFRRPILHGGVAGMSIDKGADRFAYKQGLFVISQTGDNVQILNDKKFRPRSFHIASKNGHPARKRRKT